MEKNADRHFHTPSAAQGRLAIGKDVLRNGCNYRLPEAREFARCAVCGKVIRPSAAARRTISFRTSLVYSLLCAALYMLGYFVAPRFYLYCAIAELFSPLFGVFAKYHADAFCSWEVVEYRSPEALSLLERLDRHPSRDRDASWYIKWFNLPLFLLALEHYLLPLLLKR